MAARARWRGTTAQRGWRDAGAFVAWVEQNLGSRPDGRNHGPHRQRCWVRARKYPLGLLVLSKRGTGALRRSAMPTRRDWQRYARKGTTKQRGYAGSHVRILKAAIAAWKPGDLCTEGLQHARCNTSEGATRGNRARGDRRRTGRWVTSRRW